MYSVHVSVTSVIVQRRGDLRRTPPTPRTYPSQGAASRLFMRPSSFFLLPPWPPLPCLLKTSNPLADVKLAIDSDIEPVHPLTL